MSGGAVVTGAGGGLGRELALRLASRGLVVHATDVDEAAAARTADELGGAAWSSRLDVADAEACSAAARATAERAGSLALWINNAGVLPTGHVWDHDAAERRLVMDVNVLGTMNGTLAALELMRPAGGGHVVNIVSLAGIVTPPGEALYAASKHAALAFSLGAQADLRRAGDRGVRVSAICPDGMVTPMLEAVADDPSAALSWSGTVLEPGAVADRVMRLVERPRPVVSMPRWRGGFLRLLDAAPAVALATQPASLAFGRARQRAWARRRRAARR
ncbi:MAG TPA: SDR family NAD(P)-dependent oxidoreductase [Thermoleophilaceae bacterium]